MRRAALARGRRAPVPGGGRAERRGRWAVRRRRRRRVVPPGGCGWGPGALRAGLGPAGCGSTESRCLLNVRAPPGSHPPAGTRPSAPVPRVLDLAPSDAPPCPADRPLAQRLSTATRTRVRPDILWWTRPNLPLDHLRLSTPVRPGRFDQSSRSVRRGRRHAPHPAHIVRRYPRTGDHPFSRSWTVRPPTTVRRHSGSGPPGVRSGSPGVAERGSVDQRTTLASGACTTSSPVRHTA